MKSIDDFPFQFDPDQLFAIQPGFKPQDVENVAADPANAKVLADMKAKLTEVLAPLDTPVRRVQDASLRRKRKSEDQAPEEGCEVVLPFFNQAQAHEKRD